MQTVAAQSNLTIKGFKPAPTVTKQLHAEWPIALELDGTYHNLATVLRSRRQVHAHRQHQRRSTSRARTSPTPNSTITADLRRDDVRAARQTERAGGRGGAPAAARRRRPDGARSHEHARPRHARRRARGNATRGAIAVPDTEAVAACKAGWAPPAKAGPPPAAAAKPAAPQPAPSPAKPEAPTPAATAGEVKPPAAPQPPAPEAYTYRAEGRRYPFQTLAGSGTSAAAASRRGEGPAGLAVADISVRGVMQSRGRWSR